ncbi:helix-turn-helix domain-containing protein [Nocardia testacea]|uniref:Helix-turn-helix domain-containing protein n=1 Tax=Nocardia testacea TaxID=248551 RepID=A0ABW7VRM9_9NOCA
MTIDALPRAKRSSPSPPTDRVVAIMHLLGSSPQRSYSLTEIERTLGISRATAHAILAALVGHDWIVRDPDTGGYSWGPALTALARPGGAGSRRIRARLGELAASIDCRVALFQPQGAALIAIETAGSTTADQPVTAGFTVPLVAPFGREFIAFATPAEQDAWLERIGPVGPEFATRMRQVLAEIRERRYAVERLSRAFGRVFTALHALSGEFDAITARLAAAVAELTIVDFLDDELAENQEHTVAAISAPVRTSAGTVPLTLTAVLMRPLSTTETAAIGAEIRQAADDIGELHLTYGDT